MMNLKDNDEVVDVSCNNDDSVFIATKNGYGLWYSVSAVSVVGRKASGVKGISLKDDEVVSGMVFDKNIDYVSIVTDKGTGKRIKFSEIEKGSRANRGLLLMKPIKSNPSQIVKLFINNTKSNIGIVTNLEVKIIKYADLPIMDRYSNGSYIVRDKVINVFKVAQLISRDVSSSDLKEKEAVVVIEEEEKPSKKEVSLAAIDDRIMTIDDLLNNIEKKN